MTTDVTPFVFPDDGTEIRAMMRDGDPWFVASDVASSLGYARPADAVAQHVDQEDRGTTVLDRGTSGGNPNAVIINESGLYALIFGSRLEAAKRFKRWVTAEVLPSIRRTGQFSVKPKTDLNMMRQMIDAIEEDRARLVEMEQRQDSSDQRQAVIESKLTEALGQYGEFTALGFAKLMNLSQDRVWCQRLGQRATALMRAAGRKPRKREDVSFGRINVYPREFLSEAAAQILGEDEGRS